MTKAQMAKHIIEVANIQRDNIKEVVDQICYMRDFDNRLLVQTLLEVGTSIADALNCISMILCEIMPKEE